ncbi:MAG: RpiB/LacA/LacB family sugar-phosphate isomerase [bacterium]|nr:RpiB/LacA/LacB family sugar-phosphate isomerase [bacterium]
MIIYIGGDHRGFKLKESLKKQLQKSEYTVVDCGAKTFIQDDDYPDYASKVAEKVSNNADVRGIVICGSGVGVDIVVNKYKNIRSGLVGSPDQARVSRTDDNTNILALAADFLSEAQAKKIMKTWLTTDFSHDPRHRRRLKKIADIERL